MRRTAKSLLANCPEAISKGTARDQVGEAVGVSGQMIDHHRRRLAVSQAAMCAQRARKMYDEAAAERKKRKPKDSVMDNCPEQTGTARDQAGKAVGVSGQMIDHHRRRLARG